MALQKLLFAALYLGVNAALLIDAGRSEPWLSPVWTALLALAWNLIAGLRIGHAFAQRYVEEVTRLNHLLVDQNSELVQANRELLERISTTYPEPVHLHKGQPA